MSSFVPEKVFLRGVLLHYFNMKKTAADSHRILVEVYGEYAPGDEKWIHYDNPKRKKSYMKPGQSAKSTAKPNIHGAKVMLCMFQRRQRAASTTLKEAIGASGMSATSSPGSRLKSGT